jgi:hypothetical protein
MHYEYYPAPLIEFQKELRNHPNLLAKLEGCQSEGEAYGIIGAELGIVLDGIYDLKELAEVLTTELVRRRILILE